MIEIEEKEAEKIKNVLLGIRQNAMQTLNKHQTAIQDLNDMIKNLEKKEKSEVKP